MGWRLAGTDFGGGSAGPPGPPGPPGPGGGISVVPQLINDQGADMIACAPVYSSSAGKMKLARANAATTALVIGLVQDNTIVAGTTGNVQTLGVLTKTTAQWDAVTGDSGGLVQGAQYWVSPTTAGKLVKVAPGASTNYDVLVGEAFSTTDLNLTINGQPIGPLP